MSKIKLDIFATTLSVLFFQWFRNLFRMEGIIDWNLIVIESIAGIISYGIAFVLLRDKPPLLKIPIVVYSIILGSALWVLFHIIYSIYFDWRYFSDIRPETFYERNLEVIKFSFFYLVPLLSINAFIFTLLVRTLEKIVISVFFKKDDSQT